ncbi:MAG: glycosyltransferase, partial [Candidatus Brocadiia bacterium]
TIGEEPFGLVPVEGMACAKPVVVTRSGGMVESVLDGETGFIIAKRDSDTLAEKILHFLREPDEAARFGQAGRKRAVEVFSRDRMARDTVALYEQAAEKAQARAASEAGTSAS